MGLVRLCMHEPNRRFRCIVKKVICIMCRKNENKKASGISVMGNRGVEWEGHEFESQLCHVLASQLYDVGQTPYPLQTLISDL